MNKRVETPGVIIIKNMTPGRNVAEYTVRINDGPVLATFAHIRSDGLADCLRRAADALDRSPAPTHKEQAE